MHPHRTGLENWLRKSRRPTPQRAAPARRWPFAARAPAAFHPEVLNCALMTLLLLRKELFPPRERIRPKPPHPACWLTLRVPRARRRRTATTTAARSSQRGRHSRSHSREDRMSFIKPITIEPRQRDCASRVSDVRRSLPPFSTTDPVPPPSSRPIAASAAQWRVAHLSASSRRLSFEGA